MSTAPPDPDADPRPPVRAEARAVAVDLVKAGALSRSDAVYVVFAGWFSVVLVLTNIIGTKLFYLFPDGGPSWFNGGEPVTLTAGIVTYPVTFWLTDIVSEIWGRKRADLMVIKGFLMSLFMLLILQIGVALPPSAFWTVPSHGFDTAAGMQQAYAATFRNPALLLFASMLAYLVAQLFDVRLYHFWWAITRGRHMWLRNNGSTMISQLVDTIIVNGIFLRWGFGMDWPAIWHVILWVYACKMLLALLDTPFLYWGRSILQRAFGIDPSVVPERAPLGH